MSGNELLDKMELIDPIYVDAADVSSKPKRNIWVKWVGIAACFALVIYTGTRLLLQESLGSISGILFPSASENMTVADDDTSQNSSDLPMLSVAIKTDGMGFEGLMAHDISELVDANPWNEDLTLTTLPVYQAPITYNEDYSIASGIDLNQMKAFLLEIADRLGLDTDKLTITSNSPAKDPYGPIKCETKAKGVSITVDDDLSAVVVFEPAISLPAEYNFTYHQSSYEDMVSVAEYLRAEYKNLINMDNPQINIDGGYYNIHNQQSYSISFFDASGTATEQILNYNFNQVSFSCDEEGKLRIIGIDQPDLSLKVGDYPIITSDQALEMLANGQYITTVPYEMPGLEYVKKVELIYRTSVYEEYYMPYYRFYVELPEEKYNHHLEYDLKTYGAYYVPAVESTYISPVWDGWFQ